MFSHDPELKERLCGGDFELPPTHADPLENDYLLVLGADPKTKSRRGFRGGYYVAATPASLASFSAFVDADEYDYPADLLAEVSDTLDPDDPMVCLSWLDAVAYCGWLSRETGILYTLPFAEEWSFAGACLAKQWPQTELVDAFATGNSKWLPPGLDSYGAMRAGDQLAAPATPASSGNGAPIAPPSAAKTASSAPASGQMPPTATTVSPAAITPSISTSASPPPASAPSSSPATPCGAPIAASSATTSTAPPSPTT